jgi:hypothetical protein
LRTAAIDPDAAEAAAAATVVAVVAVTVVVVVDDVVFVVGVGKNTFVSNCLNVLSSVASNFRLFDDND